MLPDDVLMEIFNFYVKTIQSSHTRQNRWCALVHVCHRWRYLVFASPRHFDLRLEYSGRRPMSEVPDAWPVLPVMLTSSVSHLKSDQRWDNMVATLESHYNRIREINIFDMTNSRWERFAAAMQKPFPELTNLCVWVMGDVVPVLPDSFLGGSAPRLRELSLEGIPFPSMPKLLLSAHGLVELSLVNIPDSGYISPDAMATVLTVMTTLESLRLQFRSPQSLPDPASRPLPPPTRFVLPALTKLTFRGVYGYSEDLLARIDAPLLDYFFISFFVDFNFDVPQLHRFIGHAEELKACNHAAVSIFPDSIELSVYPKPREVGQYTRLWLQIICTESDWQLSSFPQVCSSSFPLISALEELEIKEYDYLPSSHWNDDIEDAQWLELLDPFTALKNLYLTHEIAQRVCGALQELSGEMVTEVLPTLRNLFVDGFGSLEHIEEAIRPFVAARQLSGHPVAIDHWQRKSVLEYL